MLQTCFTGCTCLYCIWILGEIKWANNILEKAKSNQNVKYILCFVMCICCCRCPAVMYGGHTCADVNSRADLTSALPCDWVDCEEIVSSTHCMCEITGVILSQTLLDHSLVTEKQKNKNKRESSIFWETCLFPVPQTVSREDRYHSLECRKNMKLQLASQQMNT